ncbi:MAG: hypothetical protein Q7T80_02965 [Methanoregula sp.]|nr:hypothetical protein [Methanoregula sp.]
MAVAEIIGAAIGVLLLVVVAYMLVGSVLTTAEVVTTAQKDLTLQDEVRLRTAFTISDKTSPDTNFTYKISNNGTEIISDFKHVDVLVKDTGGVYYLYPWDDTRGTEVIEGKWQIFDRNPDTIHPYQLDPGETFTIRVNIRKEQGTPEWFQMTTGNGVYASAYL